MPFNCVNIMDLAQHHRLITCMLLFCIVTSIQTRSSQILDLKSKISGVEELLEEFRKQLQQDQTYTREEDEVVDVCLADFNAVEEHIIRATASIEQGATFLSAPDRVYSWKDCLHACCADPHCTVAVVQEDLRQSDDSLSCYLFSCTSNSSKHKMGDHDGKQNCPDRSDEDFCQSCAILPLALGLIITALLLLMIGCRLRLVRHKLKKARPLTTEESDYLINGMYL